MKKIITLSIACMLYAVCAQAQIINTIAGNGNVGYSGDGGPGTSAELYEPCGVALDDTGNVYICDNQNNRVRKLNTAGIITTFRSGLNGPQGITVDHNGNVYIADWGNNNVVKINKAGTITDVAGSPVTGTYGYSGDGGQATSALLSGPEDVAVDDSGNIYIADEGNNSIRKINSKGIISTFAGHDSATGFSGDGGPATLAKLHNPYGVTLDDSGNVYIADSRNNRIRKVNKAGIITTVAGTGTAGYNGDGIAATAAELSFPWKTTIDPIGNMYIVDGNNNRVRLVNTKGIISTFAGNGTTGFTGDGGPATAAETSGPISVALDAGNNLYFSDINNSRVREISHVSYQPVPTSACVGETVGFLISVYDAGVSYQWEVNTGSGFTKITNSGIYSGANTPSLQITGATLGMNGYTYKCVMIDSSNGAYFNTNVVPLSVYTCTSGCNFITSVAGTGTYGNTGNGGPATAATLSAEEGITIDKTGNEYVADSYGNTIRKINTAGIISIIAGNGTAGFAGDGGAATAAEFNTPGQVTVDATGNIYIADAANNRIRKINTAGIVTTIAGNGTAGYTGDGIAATAAELNNPTGVSTDFFNNIYIADANNNRIRKINSSGIINTEAGNGISNYSGDGGKATAAALNYPTAVAIDDSGNVFIADYMNNCVRKINAAGIINTVAGNGLSGYSGDGIAATSAQLNQPYGVAVDGSGNIYIADQFNNRIRKVSWSGIISSIAGNGTAGFNGDGEAATAAALYNPCNIALDSIGDVYIADQYNERVRKINKNPCSFNITSQPVPVTTCVDSSASFSVKVSGTGTTYQWKVKLVGSTGFGNITNNATYSGTDSATLHLKNIDYSINGSQYECVVSRPTCCTEDSSNSATLTVNICYLGCDYISTVAGSGPYTFSGDNGSATKATLSDPSGVAFDASGNMYITDMANQRIRKVNTTGIISTIAGNGAHAFSGDGGPATAAELWNPDAITTDAAGNIYIADGTNDRIRKINTAGIITTIAGNGVGAPGGGGYSGDGGEATAAELYSPDGIALDAAGDLFISDGSNNRIRMVNTAGIISTIAGNGTAGYSGDGGAATVAKINSPTGVTLDAAGNIYISDNYSSRVRKVNTAGIISTFAGNGTSGYTGNGGPATAAEISSPIGLVFDAAGNLYFTETGNRCARKINTAGIISTIAGNIVSGYSGDGDSATRAELNYPYGIATDDSGNVYVADEYNNRIREIYLARCNSILTSVNKIENGQDIKVYPNPFNGKTNIVFNVNTIHYLEVDDITGRKLQNIECKGSRYQLSEEGFSPGIYFVRINDENQKYITTKKIIMQ